MDEEPLQLDTYLDRLLAGPDAAPVAVDRMASVAPELSSAAGLLRAGLVRFHPSFRFEERLSRRLRELADRQGLPGPAPRPFAEPVSLAVTPHAADERLARPAAGSDDRHRGRLVGSAIASGVLASGLSLVGAALLAWRRGRTDGGWGRPV